MERRCLEGLNFKRAGLDNQVEMIQSASKLSLEMCLSICKSKTNNLQFLNKVRKDNYYMRPSELLESIAYLQDFPLFFTKAPRTYRRTDRQIDSFTDMRGRIKEKAITLNCAILNFCLKGSDSTPPSAHTSKTAWPHFLWILRSLIPWFHTFHWA